MYAAESNAPEGPGAQAPDLRGGCVYGHGPRRCGAAAPMGRGETPGLRGGPHAGRGEAPARCRPSARTARHPSAPPRWSCRHPVCGRVSRPRGAGGAYNAELAAAKGRSPEGGAPRGPRDGREKLSEKSS